MIEATKLQKCQHITRGTNIQRQKEASRKEEELEGGEGGEDADASLEEFPILEKNGQDQAAGFDQNDFSFGTLPPHFDDSDGPALSLEEYEYILSGYSTFYPVVFRVAGGYPVSACIHRLPSRLDKNHFP